MVKKTYSNRESYRNLVVTLADKSFIQQAKQLFSSVYWNAGWRGDYMLLSHQIPENELKWFREKGILIKECEPLIDLPTGENNYPPVVYDKLYLFTAEFKKWDCVVFFDSDIIIKSSIESLTNIKTFGAICDVGKKNLKEQFYQSKGVFNNKYYNLKKLSFNSGVMAFKTDLINDKLLSELKCLIINHYSEFRFADQAVLNLCFYKKWENLSPIYNVYIDKYNYNLPNYSKYAAIHFFSNVGYPPVWTNENPYYNEWKSNLEKAEYIDLHKIVQKKEWNRLKILFYTLLLKTINPYNNIKAFINNVLGKCGKWLKQKHPAIYFKLKSQRNGK